MFKAWSVELGKLGPDAVDRGIRAVDLSAGSYAPNLNKFIGLCRKPGSGFIVGDSYSEQLHGGRLKPTPNGVPLCWTIPPRGRYSAAELRASGIPEDITAANIIEGFSA